ncbi:hypothetical protein Aeqsu_2071 [Aequorivita sublithincola DSM 14238]|uniref:Lipoprotein n=1 Tax=Aequorivita sublithincola (strain DSM 14238 / LMG 21431 / ACAM 643 / 9-3) TaxID=746697 RepID=I3YX17_AEQSU|nr:hypothetical protein [Aequorivita sublithincola]AFL81535.1 hypothetical protein Aeqsu_2071 [Aequorivita sublithincola DSM 14238]
MKITVIIIVLTFFVGCSKKDDAQEQFLYDLDVNISLNTTSGEDLLDQTNPNSFKKAEIKTYHLINGKEQVVGADDIIFQYNNEGINYFRTFVNYEGNDEFPITYIDWSETDRDTIKAEIYKSKSRIIRTKIWYNGELKWDGNDPKGCYFDIIK